MKRVGTWLGQMVPGASSHDKALTAAEEREALEDAMNAVIHIMNDDVVRADAELATGTSAYHKLGRAVVLFLRATLGFEKDVMEQASVKLAEAEEAAYECQMRWMRDPSAGTHQSRIYPVGAQYALCQAEAQLMSAVVAVLNESLTESLKGFYKLRKAYHTLYELHQAEERFFHQHDDCTPEEAREDFRSVSSDLIDIFIHSGLSLCFGLLQLFLSMIPPAFAKLLSLFSFHGDRDTGLRMLWACTKFRRNINGAMASLIVLIFHNGPIAYCDILSKDAVPYSRLKVLLREMRELYPNAKLWLMQEASMLGAEHKLEQAIAVMKESSQSPLKQVEALCVFEQSMNYLHMHRYEDCAWSFIKCVSMNSWSHALYYYIAGSCYIELYRTYKDSDPEKAEEFASKAEKHLHEAPTHIGKKRLMGRQLPFDIFVHRKILKWDNRAKTKNCRFVDAVGVSPTVEMSYLWSGMRKMDTDRLKMCLDRLEHPASTAWQKDAADESATLAVLKAACMRFGGEIDGAKRILSEDVMSRHKWADIKVCESADTWPLPVAHYEMAVCLFEEAGGQDGDANVLRKCSAEIAKVESWETFELEARVGLKVATARETLRKCGIE
ncbi:hypothetical protein M433DRAFT_64657 [Acidomyces richmondensis BFW]|nr:MAG: hypothetical protein FE78DRAFT_29482 [Acidomyces sp. 'richmondensis']KYG46668.1 hypothetical protein M433DRAFT_64657 [Acidomyces richmondensis BFW]